MHLEIIIEVPVRMSDIITIVSGIPKEYLIISIFRLIRNNFNIFSYFVK
jgi:hypothetical protein